MKRLLRIIILLSTLGAGGAQAQLGLDLSGEDDEEEASAPPVSAEEWARQGGTPLLPSAREDVSLGDRVRAVQRKRFLKKQRLDVMPTFAVSLNDPFFTKIGGGVALTYHLADSLGLSLHYTHFGHLESENVRIAKRELRSLMLTSRLEWTGGLDLLWTPIVGKIAVFDAIIHYDFFVLAGMGAAWTQTSGGEVGDGAHPAATLGAGQRFALADWMALEISLRQLLFADRPQDRPNAEIQRLLTLNAGLSFWFPTSFSDRGSR